MGKIFYGERGSGKTVKLLKQAQALSYDGKIPVIVCVTKVFEQTLKSIAEQINIDTTNFIFTTFSEFKEACGKYNSEVYRIMIDELSVFIRDLLNIKHMSNFYATLSSEDCIEIKRSDWDKNYEK